MLTYQNLVLTLYISFFSVLKQLLNHNDLGNRCVLSGFAWFLLVKSFFSGQGNVDKIKNLGDAIIEFLHFHTMTIFDHSAVTFTSNGTFTRSKRSHDASALIIQIPGSEINASPK